MNETPSTVLNRTYKAEQERDIALVRIRELEREQHESAIASAMHLSRISELEAECFKLAAGQCVHATADEGGVPMCKEVVRLNARIAELEAQLTKPIDMVLHCPACLEQHIDGPAPCAAERCESGLSGITCGTDHVDVSS